MGGSRLRVRGTDSPKGYRQQKQGQSRRWAAAGEGLLAIILQKAVLGCREVLKERDGLWAQAEQGSNSGSTTSWPCDICSLLAPVGPRVCKMRPTGAH